MKLIFLGTGASLGVPMINGTNSVNNSKNHKDQRLRSSILIQWRNFNCLIDCGPDFRQQMLRANIAKIDAIIYTHKHADHTSGIDDLRPFYFSQGTIPIYVDSDVLNSLERRFRYIFKNIEKAEKPFVKVNLLDNNEFYINKQKVIPISINHGNLKIFGYRFNNIAYLTDVKTIDAKEKKKLFNLDILIISTLQIKKHPAHLNLEEALELIDEIKPNKAYLTHISEGLGTHNEIEKKLPKNVFLAYDELQINI